MDSWPGKLGKRSTRSAQWPTTLVKGVIVPGDQVVFFM